jgi:hypothetical protein
MDVPSGEWKPYSPGSSRREGPRLEVEAVLNSRLLRGQLRLNLVDLGFGGFAVESPIAFSPGSRHAFRFTTGAGVAVSIQADTVYCRPSGQADGMESYVSGFKYVISGGDDERAVDILIDTANSPLTIL